MELLRRVPDALLEHARSYLAGERKAALARGSSTVMLLRSATRSEFRVPARSGSESAGSELEVYMLRRHGRMAFAAGMYAFPGGAVDERDCDRSIAWAGHSAAEWARRLRCDESQARALVCAAVRETFEESGVLLAGAADGVIVDDTTGDDWERDRAALVDRSLAFSDFLLQRGLVLRADLLEAWAHWITPEFEPRRYDTRFFVAVMPEGQRPRDVSGEADRVMWVRPADAVTAADEGEMAMLLPTYVSLSELARYAEPLDVLAAAAERDISTIMPRVELVEGVPMFVEPEGRGFSSVSPSERTRSRPELSDTSPQAG